MEEPERALQNSANNKAASEEPTEAYKHMGPLAKKEFLKILNKYYRQGY
jgi:hypothetical protein